MTCATARAASRTTSRTGATARGVRRGRTLLEVTVALAITAVAALLVVPRWGARGPDSPEGDVLLAALLDDARRQAVLHRQVVTVRLAGAAARVTADTAGTAGAGPWREVVLSPAVVAQLEPPGARVSVTFHPTGVAVGDRLAVRAADGTLRRLPDAWDAGGRGAPR